MLAIHVVNLTANCDAFDGAPESSIADLQLPKKDLLEVDEVNVGRAAGNDEHVFKAVLLSSGSR